jgi:hypothetical protein
MKNFDFKKQALPHVLALVVIFIASALYFLPEFQGYEIESHDRMSYIGASKELKDYEEKGEQIFWTSRVFSGMPLFQISTSKTLNLVDKINLLRAGFPFSMNLCFGLMAGMYIALLIFGIRSFPSLIFSVVFGFSTWFLLSIEAGHSSKVKAIAYVAPLIASIVYAYRKNLVTGGVLTSVFLCLMIAANHIQIAYYSIFLIAAVFIVLLIDSFVQKNFPDFAKKSFALLAFGTIGVLPNMAVLWPSYDYSKEATRAGKSELTQSDQAETAGLSFDYAMRWSYGKLESFNLLIPGLYAGGYSPGENSETAKALIARGIPKKQAADYAKGVPMYFGSQPFTSGPTYLGAVVLLFFGLMFFVLKGNFRWALLAGFVISLFFAWGENFEAWNRLFFNNFPMFNKFRAPSMWLTLAIVSTFTGAAMAFSAILNRSFEKAQLLKALYGTVAVLGGISAVFFLFGTSIIDSFSGSYDAQLQQSGFPVDAIIADRIALMKSDALRTIFFVLAGAALIWFWLNDKIKNEKVFVAVLGLLLLADFVPVGLRYLNKDDFKPTYGKELGFKMTAADNAILQDKELNFRVFNTTVSSFNDNSTSYFHQSVGGYSAVKLFRYQDLIDYHLSKGNMKVFNMLNTKYFIQGKPGEETVRPNQGALGSVWFVQNILWAENADEEMELLNTFNPAEDVVIDKRFRPSQENSAYSASGNISLVSFHPEKMVYKSSSAEPQFAVFSEMWYKGNVDWKAYINGEEAEFVRVNYLLRGLKVPAGEHEIVFKFRPETFYKGNMISLISSLIIFLLIGFALYMAVKNPSEHAGIKA